ncbi:deoxyribodipyrimidine photo-lyase, partial [Acinetobacter baumannii]
TGDTELESLQKIQQQRELKFEEKVLMTVLSWQKQADASQRKKELEQLNIPLIIQVIPYWKDIADYIGELSTQLNIENVYSNIEIGVNELKRDKTVQDFLNQQGKELFLFHDR